jgi:hypothetical protein
LWLRVGAVGTRVTVLGRRVREASGAVVVMGGVRLVLGRVDGRVQGVRVQKIPSYHILVCPVLVHFEVSHKGSRVGVGKDIMQLLQNVSGIGLERLLRNCPVCHSKQ